MYVDGVNGTDGENCLSSNSTLEPCKTLSYVAKHLKPSVGAVDIIVISDQLDLTEPVTFENFTQLRIYGKPSKIDCDDHVAGLAFLNTEDLDLHSLSIENCGAKRISTSYDPQTNMMECLLVSVFILHCTDVTIEDSQITSSNGRGLSMYDTDGAVSISNCVFNDNHVNESSQVGGGGLYIEFTFCGTGKVSNCYNHKGIQNSRYFVTDCIFSNNIANVFTNDDTVISPYTPLSVLRNGKGGGMYITVGYNATNNTFIVKNCTFHNNSATSLGGGMLAEFLNSVKNTTIHVLNTTFLENHCTQETTCSAGGLVVTMTFYNQLRIMDTVPKKNMFECTSCRFKGNRGGGLTIFASKDNVCPYRYGRVSFRNSEWIENKSPMGAAVVMNPAIWDFTKEGCLPVPRFVNCTFEKNSALESQPSFTSHGANIRVTSLGYGAMSVTQFKVCLEGNIRFMYNQGTAVHISNTVLEVVDESVIEFIGNTAHKGGAIAMYGTSVLQFRNNTTFNFFNNSAGLMGGAIYIEFDTTFHPSYQNCFVQAASGVCEKANTATLNFEGNYARVTGASIYAPSFRSCAFLCHINSTSPEYILQHIANFKFTEPNQLATRPTKYILNTTAAVHMIPGIENHLPLLVKDETGANLTGVVYEASVNSTNNNVSIDPAFNQVSNNTIMMLGAPNKTTELQLLASGSDVVLSFNVSFTHCQPGYELYNGSKCVCAVTKYIGLVGCDPEVKLKDGYWIGFCSDNSNELCTTFCPHGFCSYHNMSHNEDLHPLPDDSAFLESSICGPNRAGRLCGKCAKNYSVFYHSEEYTCGKESLCHLGLLFYLLSEALPLLILFVIILRLNISFTDGNINCFVLYAQTLDFLAIEVNGSLPYYIQVIHTIMKFIYRPLNLNFFTLEELSFCLWRGANVLDVMIMKATTVALALALVVTTILLARCRCARLRIFARFRTPRSVIIHGLSAFFVLCYSQGARQTFHVLNFFCLYSANFNCNHKVVYLAGYMNYMEGDHIKYAIIAILVLIFMVIIPPLLLLLYPLIFKLLGLCKLSESRITAYTWRLMPIQILDAFQSSFKDRYRFFAGLYFFYRAIILAAYAYSGTVFQFYSAVQLQLILVLAVHAIFQPYKKRKHNIVDALLFTNLAVINAITLFKYTRKDVMGRHISQFTVNAMEFIQAVLMLMPFLCIIVYIISERVKKIRKAKDMDDLPPLRSNEHTPLKN